MNNQSFFKLPLIFSLCYGVCSLRLFFIMNGIDFDTDIDLFILFLTHQSLATIQSFIFIVFITTIIFSRYGFNQLNTKNILLLLLMVIIVCLGHELVYYLLEWIKFWPLLGRVLNKIIVLSFTQKMITITMMVKLLYYTLSIGLIWLSVKICSYFFTKTPFDYRLVSLRKVYAQLFSLSMLVLGIIIFRPIENVRLLLRWFSYDFSTVIFAALIFIVCYLVQYLLIYFATINCFTKVGEQIEWGKLFKSIGLSLLFIIIGSLILAVILFIIRFVIMGSHHYDYERMMIASLTVLLVGVIIGIAIYFISIRKAIKIVFANKSANLPLVE